MPGLIVLDPRSMTSTGYTRDGVWLIEKGVVTKPVKNFRFIESPLGALNRIDALGTPMPVFQTHLRFAPPALVRDFNFVALSDAV